VKKVIVVKAPPGLDPETIASIKDWWTNSNQDPRCLVLPDGWKYEVVEAEEILIKVETDVVYQKQEQE
jgi:hypothetical protein